MAKRRRREDDDEYDDDDDVAPTRQKPQRPWGVFSLAALAVLAAGIWMAPAVLVQTQLRDRPLESGFAGIDGSIASGSATWSWLGPIEYRNVVLRDAAGLPAVIVQSVVVEKGLLGLMLDPKSLGAVRLAGVEAAVMVRRGGSSLEDILAPWLAAPGQGASVTCDLELVGGSVDLVDTTRNDVWRINELFAVGTLKSDGSCTEWTAAGRLRHAGNAPPLPPAVAPPQDTPTRLDRATIPAATSAVLARDGGWSISSSGGSERTIAVTANRLPLGGSSVLATRLGLERLIDGLADLRLDVSPGASGNEIKGRVVAEQFAVCRADTLAEEFAVSRCELPLHVSFAGEDLVVHELRFTSPVARGEITGRLPWPGADAWSWFEDSATRDWTFAADVDLASVARSLPGGLEVRPDVRVTDGNLRLSASTRRDGADRVVEVRLDARDLAAVRAAAGTRGETDAAGSRPLRWNEPLSSWLRARRGPGRGSALVVEEAQISSPSFELKAAGTPAALAMQWTVDLGGLMREVAELVDTGGMVVAGTCRGRLDLDNAAGLTRIKATASGSDFQWAAPGREAWDDEAIAIDAETTGTFTTSVAMIQSARGMITARGDSLEATLAGGAVVDLAGLLAGKVTAAIRPAGRGEVAADCSVVGDVGRWHRRVAAIAPSLGARGLELAGTLQAAASVAAAGDAWRITKAGGEIEKFSLVCGDRRASEPRIVATAAGIVRPSTGSIDISSAEFLSTTLSLRTGGVSWSPSARSAELGPLDMLLDGLRGRMQWQADLARVEPWLVAADVANRWPLSGRAWGTLDVSQNQNGLNLLVEATGSQVTIAQKAAGADGQPRTLWTEPQATIAMELTRPLIRAASGGLVASDRLVVDRLEVANSTLALAARGGIAEASGSRQASLDGTISYDWEQLSRLATPWTGGKVRVVGSGGRPFAARATFSGVAAGAHASVARAPGADSLPLPEAWLSAIQSKGSDPVAARAAVRPPVTPTTSSRTLAEQLTALSFETSAAWTAADIDGFPVAAGDMPVRLVEGQLAFGPFDVAAGGGRIRGAPWIKLSPAPGELFVPPGRIVERVALTGEFCRKSVAVISPLLAGTTQTSGLVTIDLAGARVPLGDAMAGEAAGQIVFEQFEVTPSGAMQPLINLLARLQSVIDPRFALGDKVVLLRVRPDPIRVRLGDRRVWHDGLVMDAGQLTVSSRGSVGADGTIAAVVEVAFRGDVAGQTPVVAQLLRTPIAIPLKGTVARPQFDAAAMDVILQRIVENTARAVINDGIGRGLDALLGNPQQGQPAPLRLP
jgi:hypothetical protein